MIIRNTKSLVLTSIAILAACSSGELSVGEPAPADIGQAEQAIGTSCVGANDTESLSAMFAVAMADELGRWDVANDFIVANGKLEYSSTGILLCGSGGVSCPKTTALLRLQDDASSSIPNHSPSSYRATLVSRFNTQVSVLTSMVDQMLNVDEGIYQIRNQRSGKLIVPQGGSTASGALLQQSDQYSGNTASQWRVTLKGTRQRLQNIKSGLCMDLQTNTTGVTNLVQRACNSTSSTQGFRLAQNSLVFWLRTAAAGMTVAVNGSSTANNAGIVQNAMGAQDNQYFSFVPVGSGAHRDLLATATAVYALKATHSGQFMAMPSASLTEGLGVVQNSYVSTDKRFHWYITPVAIRPVNGVPATFYQLINRRTGKCLDLSGAAPSKAVQKTCSTADSQLFLFVPTGEGTQVIYTAHGVTLGVQSGSTASGAAFVEGGSTWQTYNKLELTPILAGEPHQLTWAFTSPDGAPCGVYDWFDIKRPNGNPLEDPADTYVQLIFAGGKQTRTGTDLNPYIAQQVNGNQVAIDPTYGLDDTGSSGTAACTASCVRISTANIGGQCCSCNGVSKKFAKSPWNTVTFLCQ